MTHAGAAGSSDGAKAAATKHQTACALGKKSWRRNGASMPSFKCGEKEEGWRNP